MPTLRGLEFMYAVNSLFPYTILGSKYDRLFLDIKLDQVWERMGDVDSTSEVIFFYSGVPNVDDWVISIVPEFRGMIRVWDENFELVSVNTFRDMLENGDFHNKLVLGSQKCD